MAPRKSYLGLIVGLVAFGVLAAIVMVGISIVLHRVGSDSGGGGDQGGGGTSQSGAGSDIPATRQPDGSVVVAEPGVSRPVLDIYEDFTCPVCQSFESTSGSTLSDLAAQGKVKLVYRPFRLFDQEPQRSNSARAANAAACAPASGWVALHRLLFQSQPPEGTPGFTPTELLSLGRQAGISDSGFAPCVMSQQKASDVEKSTLAALNAGVKGTPTLKLNGVDLGSNTVFDPGSLRAAILGGQSTTGV
jgi:protein-disulfide isomerase